MCKLIIFLFLFSVSNALQIYTAPETLEDGKIIQRSFTKLAKTLIFHISRKNTVDVTTENKLNFEVIFEEQLDLSSFEADNSLAMYTLGTVVAHRQAESGGHYITFTRSATSGGWTKYDDKIAHPCSKTEAVEMNHGGRRLAFNGYLLVYNRNN